MNAEERSMYRRWMRIIALAAICSGLFLGTVMSTGLSKGTTVFGPVVVMRWDGPLNPIWEQHLTRALLAAQNQDASALVIELNTPGGSVILMNLLVQRIRSSPIPVVVYVSPAGAMAASAGTMLTLAGHAAAMAPETAIGAASPVGAQGEDIGATMEAKEKEMLRATVRSLAEWRGQKAVDLAEATIETAKAVSVSEALEAGLVDIRARDLNDLIAQLDGRSVRLAGEAFILHTTGASIIEIPQTYIEQLLVVLANPNLVFLLLSIGVQAILIELSSPGGWVAGFVGVVCLALAVYGLGILPVNWFGMIFLIVAFVLFFLEIKAPTHGGMTIAGVTSFIVGALVLFNSQHVPSFQRVSIPLVVGTALFLGAIFMLIMSFAVRAQFAPIRIGDLGNLVGQVGIARGNLAPEGPVQLGSELWTARLIDPRTTVRKGERVEVVAVDGLNLTVRKWE
jgi:membrane-bound serine protease (ClpP class)